MSCKRPIALTGFRLRYTRFSGCGETNEINNFCLSTASKTFNGDSIELSKKVIGYILLRFDI